MCGQGLRNRERMDCENPVTQTLAVSRAKVAKGENSVAGTQNEQKLRRSGHSLNSQKRNSSHQRCRTETKGELGEILFSLLLYSPPLAEFSWKSEEKAGQFQAAARGTEQDTEEWGKDGVGCQVDNTQHCGHYGHSVLQLGRLLQRVIYIVFYRKLCFRIAIPNNMDMFGAKLTYRILFQTRP